MDWADQTGSRARTTYRAHGRPRSRARAVASRLAAALIVFVLALLLVTGIEAVVGHPLSGGSAGHTTLGDLVHPSR